MTKTKLAGILLSIVLFIGVVSGVFFTLSMTGTIHIIKNDITLTSDTFNKVYDGESSDASSVSVTKGTLYEGDALEVTFSNVGSDTGSYTNQFDAVIRNKDGKDVTSSYNITKEYGTVTVTSRPLVIKAVSETEVYDGKTLEGSEYEIVSGELVGNDTLDVTFDGEITDVGEEIVSCYVIVKNEDDKDVTSNYRITTLDGTLTKTKVSLKLYSMDMIQEYDGTTLMDLSTSPYKMDGSLAEGDTLVYTPENYLSDVGTKANSFTYQILNKDGKDITDHYSVDTEYGTLAITPKKVRFVSKNHTDDCPYNGQTYIFNDIDDSLASATKLADGEHMALTFTTSVENVGEYENKFIVSISNGDKDTTSNYDITFEYGTIVITPLDIVVSTPSATKQYDGKTGGWVDTTGEEVDITKAILVSGAILPTDDLIFDADERYITAGEYNNLGTVRIVDISNKDVTKNYNMTINYGALVIYKRSIVIKSLSASCAYDSKNPVTLTNPEWYLVTGSLAEGETLSVKCVGSQTTVGSSENEITYQFYDKYGSRMTNALDNYNVTTEPGVLSVYDVTEKKTAYIAPIDMYIQIGTVQKTTASVTENILEAAGIAGFDSYLSDATHKYAISAEFEIVDSMGNVIPASEFDPTVSGIYRLRFVSSKDEYDNVTYDITITDDGANVTSLFELHPETGLLKIYSEEIELSTKSDSVSYTGTALSNHFLEFDDSYTEISSGSIDEDTYYSEFTSNGFKFHLEYESDSSITEPGKIYNYIVPTALYVNDDTENVLSDYYINVNPGTLEVKKISISIATGSAEGSYSAGASFVSNDSFTIVGELVEGHEAKVQTRCILTKVGMTESNTLGIIIVDALGNDVTDYYNIKYTYGTLRFNA